MRGNDLIPVLIGCSYGHTWASTVRGGALDHCPDCRAEGYRVPVGIPRDARDRPAVEGIPVHIAQRRANTVRQPWGRRQSVTRCPRGHEIRTTAKPGKTVRCRTCGVFFVRKDDESPKESRTHNGMIETTDILSERNTETDERGAALDHSVMSAWLELPLYNESESPAETCTECESETAWTVGRTSLYCMGCGTVSLPSVLREQTESRELPAVRADRRAERVAAMKLRADRETLAATLGEWMERFDPTDLPAELAPLARHVWAGLVELRDQTRDRDTDRTGLIEIRDVARELIESSASLLEQIDRMTEWSGDDSYEPDYADTDVEYPQTVTTSASPSRTQLPYYVTDTARSAPASPTAYVESILAAQRGADIRARDAHMLRMMGITG